MIDSLRRTVPSAERFECIGVPADPHAAARTRDDFSTWLEGAFALDPDKTGDLVLAIYEALANTAEYAYVSTGRMGTMDIQAAHDPSESALLVTVSDRGLWRTASPSPQDRSRGRGIALMKALADRVSIQTSTAGTTVLLAWNGVHRR